MKVYIPCFFNSILEREERFYKCLSQYLKLKYEVIIYWMNKEDIAILDKGITVLKGSINNASYARNRLLEIFYSSDDEYGIFSDDDTFLKYKIVPTRDCESYVNDFEQGVTNTEKISSSFLVLKNIRPKVFFDESLEANQDLDFGIQLNKKDISSYRISTKQVEIFRGTSSMFKNGMDKIYKKQWTLKQIQNKYENLRNTK